MTVERSLRPSGWRSLVSLRRRSSPDVLRLLDWVARDPHSYAAVGATRGDPPVGYEVDRYSAEIGRGDATFQLAKAALRNWTSFRLPWIHPVCATEVSDAAVVAVVTRVLGLWWVNVSRVVYTFDEPHRFGFAYGTLTHHAESGEERFSVSYDPVSTIVTYSVLAFSRPQLLVARLGYPLVRATQRRFARGTVAALRNAVTEDLPSGSSRDASQSRSG